MKKYAIVLVFISVLAMRIVSVPIEGLSEGTRVRISIPTVDYPEYTDSLTIVKRGEWEVLIKGYTDFIPGSVVEVEGVIDERGRVVAEKSEIRISKNEIGATDTLLIALSKLRHWAVGRLQSVLPEPHASLAVGILLGVKRNMPRDFYDQLVNTGTLHIVAASGYNVSVVSGAVIGLFGGFLGQRLGLLVGIVSIIFYVILAGSSASIVRAGVMGGLALIGLVLGRQRDARHLLWVAVFIMLLLKPRLITDVGFLLSVSATVGLLYITPVLMRYGQNKYFVDYLYPTLAATSATAPVIWWFFGRVSLIGILVNMLILPVVPVIMLLSALTIIITPVSYLLYVPLWWMVWVIRLFG